MAGSRSGKKGAIDNSNIQSSLEKLRFQVNRPMTFLRERTKASCGKQDWRIENMNATDVIPDEVEKERLREVAELVHESGPGWDVDYKPGSFGCHELLDRTAMFADLLEQQIQRHPACVAKAEWFSLAEQAAGALRELYQQIGSEHLATDGPAES